MTALYKRAKMKMKSISVKSKLYAFSVFITFCFIIFGFSGVNLTGKVADTSLTIFEESTIPVTKLQNIRSHVWNVYYRLIVHASTFEDTTMQQMATEITELSKHIESELTEFSQINADYRKTSEDILALWQPFLTDIGMHACIRNE